QPVLEVLGHGDRVGAGKTAQAGAQDLGSDCRLGLGAGVEGADPGLVALTVGAGCVVAPVPLRVPGPRELRALPFPVGLLRFWVSAKARSKEAAVDGATSSKEGDVPVSDIPHIHAMQHPSLVLSKSSPFCCYSPEKFPEGRRNRSGGILDRQARSQRRQRPPVSMFESPAR